MIFPTVGKGSEVVKVVSPTLMCLSQPLSFVHVKSHVNAMIFVEVMPKKVQKIFFLQYFTV